MSYSLFILRLISNASDRQPNGRPVPLISTLPFPPKVTTLQFWRQVECCNASTPSAAYARSKHKIERVAIVDMDVHHGNGTQACFYGDPNILYISTHQHPFYPGSGHYNELGEGEGRGYTLNLPLRKGTDDSSFVPIYSKIIPRVLDQYAPQLILVSAGFDGHYNDPLGELSLTPAGYASAAASLMLAAERLCNGRICFILEGGYHMQALQECVYAVMTQMAKQYPEELSIPEGTAFQEIAKQAGLFCAGKWNW
jgi:acetoin utilization deacetylase AcuC-like enzyme